MNDAILITGSDGYIGSVLNPLVGSHVYIDAFFYGGDGWPRDLRDDILLPFNGAIGAIVHLGALSNDPLGELDEKLTEDINLHATVRLAKTAKRAHAKRFIFASSQSIYGISASDEPLTEDAPKNPLTAYARTKWEAE